MSVNGGRSQSPYWPQTLHYALSWRCDIAPCPQRSYDGLWALPINQFHGDYLPSIQQHRRAAMVRAATVNASADLDRILMDHFNRAYTTNRAPIMLTLDAQLLQSSESIDTLRQFLVKILAMNDTWIVTANQAIAWMRQPTTTDRLSAFAPWQCSQGGAKQRDRTAEPCAVCFSCEISTHNSHRHHVAARTTRNWRDASAG